MPKEGDFFKYEGVLDYLQNIPQKNMTRIFEYLALTMKDRILQPDRWCLRDDDGNLPKPEVLPPEIETEMRNLRAATRTSIMFNASHSPDFLTSTFGNKNGLALLALTRYELALYEENIAQESADKDFQKLLEEPVEGSPLVNYATNMEADNLGRRHLCLKNIKINSLTVCEEIKG